MVSQAIDYFSRSLENEGLPVGAYTGVAYAMRQAGRFDDLQWLAEIYLERFDHVYVTAAAAHLAELHLQHGRHRAAAEVSARFLPPGAWRERLDAGRLDATLARLLLPRLAHWPRSAKPRRSVHGSRKPRRSKPTDGSR